jgi:hypothetical protein
MSNDDFLARFEPRNVLKETSKRIRPAGSSLAVISSQHEASAVTWGFRTGA